MARLPDCPARIGDVHFISGAEHVREDFVDLSCSYHALKKGAPGLLAGIRALYYTPPAGAARIPGPDYCQHVSGESNLEHIGPRNRSGTITSGDHFIWVSYLGHNFPPKKARRAALRLMRDLIGEGRVVACVGAQPPGPGSGDGATQDAFEVVLKAYLALEADYAAREADVEAMEDAAGIDLDAQSQAWAERSAAAEALAEGAAGLDFPTELDEAAADLVAAAREQARLWRLLAGDMSPEAMADAGFDDPIAAEDAAFAASSARQTAQEKLRQALGPLPSAEPGAGPAPSDSVGQ